MKKILWILLIALFAMGNSCTDGKQEISGGTTNTIEVDNVEIEMWQVNGIIYVREDRGIQGVDCIAIDSSTLYPDVPSNLFDFNAARTVGYTAEEIAQCDR